MSGNRRYVPPPIASQTSITSTVPMTSANTSLKYSDRSGHLPLVTGNLTTSLRPAYWTFVQSRRIASCPGQRAALTASWPDAPDNPCSAAASVGMRDAVCSAAGSRPAWAVAGCSRSARSSRWRGSAASPGSGAHRPVASSPLLGVRGRVRHANRQLAAIPADVFSGPDLGTILGVAGGGLGDAC